jgi:hypothetical protein
MKVKIYLQFSFLRNRLIWKIEYRYQQGLAKKLVVIINQFNTKICGLSSLSFSINKILMAFSSIKECSNFYIINATKIVNTNHSLVGNLMRIMKKKCSKINHSKSFWDMSEDCKDIIIDWNLNMKNKFRYWMIQL